MSRSIRQILRFAAVGAGLLAGACEAPPPGNELPTPDRAARLERTLQSVVSDWTPTQTLAPAGPRGRWEDVDLALYWATGQDGVEMGVVGRTLHDWGWLYRLKTIEGWPVTFRIERAPGERVYERHAEVGRFPDMPERRERARRLEEAFDRFMRELGRKKKLTDREGGDAE